jgi:hypothetical protein
MVKKSNVLKRTVMRQLAPEASLKNRCYGGKEQSPQQFNISQLQ